MRAIILAAGLGTRLMPLTESRPKALIPFKGVPLLERIIRNLGEAGISEIVVNVHHFADLVEEFLEQLEVPGVTIYLSDERNQLMNTGGSLLHARDQLMHGEDFLVHNVDVITNLDIQSLIKAHRKGGSLATLAVKKRNTSRSLLFDSNGFLAGWRHNETGEEKFVRKTEGVLDDFGNTCVQVINKEFFSHFSENLPLNLTEMYLTLAKDYRIQPFVHNVDYWYDLGRYENLIKADKEVF
jgi:MurNAc alpha-1-phosphate uridylyltransferase